MSTEVQTELERIKSNVAAAYASAEEQGADMPAAQNTDNLAETVSSIKSVKFTEQALDEAQQAQARENIGIKDMLMGDSSEITPSQVYEAITDGRDVMIAYDYGDGPITFTSFSVAGSNFVFSSLTVIDDDVIGVVGLVGYTLSDEWVFTSQQIPTMSDIPTVPDALKNPYALTINGTSYDGSKFVNITIEGVHIGDEPPTDPDVDLWVDTDEEVEVIPGKDGQDGVSPTVEVATITGGHRISITDKNGTKTVDVMDGGNGKDGQDGNGIKSAVLNADYTLTLTFDNGTSYTTPSIRGADGKEGKNGTSVTVKSVSESTADGGNNVVTFSDGKTLTVKNGSKGTTGTSVTVSKVTESTVDGGSNVVEFSDGKKLTVKNGSKGDDGDPGHTPVRGVDYWNPDDVADIESYIATELAKRGQLKPEFANSIEECTDTTKLYVLPDGYIYAYVKTEITKPPYTNVLSTATDSEGKPYGGTNGEKGYKTGHKVSTTGVESEHENSCCTGFIAVNPNDIIRIKNTKRVLGNGCFLLCNKNYQPAVAAYYEHYEDANRGYNTKPDTNGIISITVPGGVYNIRYSTGVIDDTSIITINEEIAESGSVTTIEYKWMNTGHAFVPADYEDRIVAVEKDIAKLKNSGVNDAVNILVPSSDVAVVGQEYNIYKNTIVFGSKPVDHYDIVIKINDSTAKPYNYNEVWRFTPTTTGTYTITITVRDRKMGNNAIYATKTMTLYVVANTAVTGKNVLFIGDSLTYAGKYAAEIQHNLSGGGITSVGTVERTVQIVDKVYNVVCEGRNGWATWDYAGTWEDSLTKFQSDSNVFRNPDTNQFDLSYYMQKYHPGVTLNAVCLNLGTNGVGATVINVAGMSELISRIRAYSATIPILVHVPIVEAPGEFYAHLGQTSPYMQMRWVELAEAFIKGYDGTMTNVYVVPVYFNLDENNDFPKTTMPVSARNPATIDRITDGHPNTYGYLKMADVYYAHLLKYMT